jgi:PAS domain S-box-containing protein
MIKKIKEFWQAVFVNSIKTLVDILLDKIIDVKNIPVCKQDEIGKLVSASSCLLETLKWREESLAKSMKKYSEIFDQSPIAIEWYDDAGFLVSVNGACLKLFGVVDRSEIIKFNLFKDPNITQEIKTKILNGESVRFEAEFSFEKVKNLKLYRTTCSGIIILDCIITPMKIDDVVVGYIEQIQDITERRQLRKALIEAGRLSAIGEMSSGVAHDFNNSLQIILGNLELALDDPEIPQQTVEFIKIAKKSAGDAASRVRQLQRFTKRKKEINHSSLDLNILLDQAIFQARPLWKDEAQKKGIQISFRKTYGNILSIDGEEGELSSVLHNLIKNAIEAMPSGGEIIVETGIADNNVFIKLSDNGIGMNEDTRMRIFQPFFSTKGFELGRGLGMSNAYSIVRDHSGSIVVANTMPGEGTTIRILFPAGKIKAENNEVSLKKDDFVSAKILWVDDEAPIREMGKIFIERLGHVANFASNGIEAIIMLQDNKYDLLITDVGMPEMNGKQLLERIGGLYPDMKVAILSGWGEVETLKQNNQDNYILEKPTKMMELKKIINEVMMMKKK